MESVVTVLIQSHFSHFFFLGNCNLYIINIQKKKSSQYKPESRLEGKKLLSYYLYI